MEENEGKEKLSLSKTLKHVGGVKAQLYSSLTSYNLMYFQ
jgi:hypothetical protein